MLLLLTSCAWVSDEDHQTRLDPDGDGSAWPADCAPEDPAVAPGLDEVCGDGVDNDCDGQAGECGWAAEMDLASAGRIQGSLADAGFGLQFGAVGDLDGDGLSEIAASATEEPEGKGGVYVFRGPAEGTLTPDQAWFKVRPAGTGQLPGLGAPRPFDLDGSGIPDLVTTTWGLNGYGGGVYIFADPVGDDLNMGEATWYATSSEPGVGIGYTARAGPDITGDGLDDLVVTAMVPDGVLNEGGEGIYILSVGMLNGSGEDTIFLGSAGDSVQLGASTELADCTGDGLADLILGSPGASTVDILEGPAGPQAEAWSIKGKPAEDLGAHVLVPGDVDGDGTPDIVAGAPGRSRSYLIQGGTDFPNDAEEAWGFLDGAEDSEFGASHAAPGDTDGDGRADVLVCAPAAAECWLLVDYSQGTHLIGPEGSRAGAGAGAGDLNGDGVPELFIGAPSDDGGGSDAGAVYIIPGAPGL